MAKKFEAVLPTYIRVGTDYFKVIDKIDRFGIVRSELKRWKKEEIRQDHLSSDKYFLEKIPKYDDFIIEPDNNGLSLSVGNCYNLYSKFEHLPAKGKWKWTKILLEHIFGNQYTIALIYLKVLYEYPKQALPILTLVSKIRQTGKSTFLDWLNIIFGANVAMIEPDVIGSSFNSEYASSNIICIDETILDKQIAVEKIKSLATKKFISVNMKNVSQFKIPFFGKIILASNNEDKFMKIDSEEIRFWVRKVETPTITNHNILNDLVDEIPAFLFYLKSLPTPDFSASRMVFTPEQIENKYLDAVKSESKSGLFKEICEVISEVFNENDTLNDVFFTPKDLKSRFFLHENNISINYIRRVLKTEFNLQTLEIQRYTVLDLSNIKLGRPFTLKKCNFNNDTYFEFCNKDEEIKLVESQQDNIPF